MGRYRRHLSEEQMGVTADERYNLAYKRVKRIKGFYIHLFVYLIVNTLIIVGNKTQTFDVKIMTDIDGINLIKVSHFQIYFQVTNDALIVLNVWDINANPQTSRSH